MNKYIFRYGIISGILLAIVLISMAVWMRQHNGEMPHSMVIGYATMLVGCVPIVLGMLKIKKDALGGRISFGKAFLAGISIALIGAVIYTATWAILYKLYVPDFMDNYIACELQKLKDSGASAAEIDKFNKEAIQSTAVYNTWPGLIAYTMLEIFPVGIIVSLVSAPFVARLRNKQAI